MESIPTSTMTTHPSSAKPPANKPLARTLNRGGHSSRFETNTTQATRLSKRNPVRLATGATEPTDTTCMASSATTSPSSTGTKTRVRLNLVLEMRSKRSPISRTTSASRSEYVGIHTNGTRRKLRCDNQRCPQTGIRLNSANSEVVREAFPKA